MANLPLAGFGVVSFEHRMADTVCQLVEKYGGKVLSAPAMQEVPLEDEGPIRVLGEALLKAEVDIVVCMTGVGTEMLLQSLGRQYELSEVREALSRVVTVVRGPKPLGVLRNHEIPIAVSVPEPNTWREILETLRSDERSSPLAGKSIAIQEYGESNKRLISELEQEGARVMSVPVYRWDLPSDTEPLRLGIQAMLDGRAQAALFTSRIQIVHLFRYAAQMGWQEALQRALNRLVVGSIGPVCSEALRSYQVPIDFEPSRPKMAIFIREVAEQIPALYRRKMAC